MIVSRILCVLIGYVLGLFQTGFIYGKTQKIDIRQHGSGNAGTTNTLRTLGFKAGLITFIGDCGKAALAIFLAWLIFPAIAKLPEAIFQVLLLDRRDIFCHMTVKSIADILSVRDIFHNSIFPSELFYLQTAEIFRRRRIDRIEISILFFELIDPFIDMFQHFDGKLTVLHQRFFIIQLL